MMVGLELREREVLALAVADDGGVTARAAIETQGATPSPRRPPPSSA